MLAYMVLFIFIGVIWAQTNSSIPKIFYIQISEVYNNPLLMETKAFCSFKQFLKPTFMSEEEVIGLSPLASSLVPQMPPAGIIFGFSNRNNSSTRTGRNLQSDDLLLRNYRGYAVSKRNWEYSGLPVWQGFVNRREIQVPKSHVIADNESFSLYASGQAVGKAHKIVKNFEEAQSLLSNNWKKKQFSVELFSEGKMSQSFYTEEILGHIQALHFTVDSWEILRMSRFEVIGCLEKPSGRFVSIVLAIRADIP